MFSLRVRSRQARVIIFPEFSLSTSFALSFSRWVTYCTISLLVVIFPGAPKKYIGLFDFVFAEKLNSEVPDEEQDLTFIFLKTNFENAFEMAWPTAGLGCF